MGVLTLVKHYQAELIALGSPILYRHFLSTQFAGLTSEQGRLALTHSSYWAIACAYHTTQRIHASLEVRRRWRAYCHQLP